MKTYDYTVFHEHLAELIPASDPCADWLQTQYRTYLHPSDRRKLFLIRALRVLAEEEKYRVGVENMRGSKHR